MVTPLKLQTDSLKRLFLLTLEESSLSSGRSLRVTDIDLEVKVEKGGEATPDQ